MKKVFLTVLKMSVASLIAFMLVLGTISCFLNVTTPVETKHLSLIVAVFSVLGVATSFSGKLRKYIVGAAIIVAAVVFIYYFDEMRIGFLRMTYFVTYHLNRIFGIKILGAQYNSTAHLPIVWFAASIMAYFTGLMQGYKRGIWIIAALNLPFVCYALLFVNAATPVWLILFTASAAMLMFTNGIRRIDPSAALEKTVNVFLPVVTVVALAVMILNPNQYFRPTWVENVRIKLEEYINLGRRPYEEADDFQIYENLDSVDLLNLGKRNVTGKKVLEFRSSTKIKYLKGVTYAICYEKEWRPNYNVMGAFPYVDSMQPKYALEVKTEKAHPQIFTAYYLATAPKGTIMFGDRYLHNTEALKEYTVIYGDKLYNTVEEYDVSVEHTYSDPGNLWPFEYLEENGLLGKSASEIAEHVRSAAVYDETVSSYADAVKNGKVKSNSFAEYFLTESRRGYCVHFATATVMLLRANGIPARYVTGYASADWEAETVNYVTDRDSHAWVEYYEEGKGWFVLDPTPGIGESEEPENNSSSVSPDNNSSEIEQGSSASSSESEQNSSASSSEPEQNSSENAESSKEPTSNEMQVSSDGADGNTTELPITHLLKPFAILAVLVVFLIGRRHTVIAYRARRIRKGNKNEAVLLYWKLLSKLLKELAEVPSEDCLLVARKARFGNKTVTDEELSLVKTETETFAKNLEKTEKHSIKRFWHRYINILY